MRPGATDGYALRDGFGKVLGERDRGTRLGLAKRHNSVDAKVERREDPPWPMGRGDFPDAPSPRPRAAGAPAHAEPQTAARAAGGHPSERFGWCAR